MSQVAELKPVLGTPKSPCNGDGPLKCDPRAAAVACIIKALALAFVHSGASPPHAKPVMSASGVLMGLTCAWHAGYALPGHPPG